MANQYEKDRVWNKGKIVRGKDPALYRRDDFGNMIYYHSYGKHSNMGWEIDHKRPKSKGGSETLWNKRPLQTHQNRLKSNIYPYYG